MRTGLWSVAVGVAALTIFGCVTPGATAQTPADDYPYQGQPGYTLDATVSQVDADRDRVIVSGDDGRTYTLDTYHAAIKLRETDRAGRTGDLVPGMRLHVVGTRVSPDLIEVDRVSILPYRSASSAGPADGKTGGYQTGQRVTLRGTVTAVDDGNGSFVLHINDHTRRIFVSDDTELRDLNDNGGDALPLHAGDRVSVVGVFNDDGTVNARLVTPRRLDAADATPVPTPDAEPVRPHDRTLAGRITQESSYFSRDIKVRLNPDVEVTVHVPKKIPIRSDGRDISVHDLHKDEFVRVSGAYEGGDFKASRIEVTGDDGD